VKNLLIFPYNGNGLEALDCLNNEYNFIGFIDDTIEKQGLNKNGFYVYDRSAFEKYQDALILAVPGGPTTYQHRRKIISELNISPERFTTIIHPSAVVSKMAKIGINSLIMAGVVITSNSIIGENVCVLPNTVIHHDSIIGNYSLIGSNVTIAGGSIIGENCYLGSGSKIINGISIGQNSLIGLGSNVIRNVKPNIKVAGNPAIEI
jgi:sugar O-acyltransferase (sialic acid O-acetyltransferase NeuD family)